MTPEEVYAVFQEAVKGLDEWQTALVSQALMVAIAAEREACAKLAEHFMDDEPTAHDSCKEIAAAIRGRKP